MLVCVHYNLPVIFNTIGSGLSEASFFFFFFIFFLFFLFLTRLRVVVPNLGEIFFLFVLFTNVQFIRQRISIANEFY